MHTFHMFSNTLSSIYSLLTEMIIIIIDIALCVDADNNTINAVVGGGDGGWSLLKLKQFVKRMDIIQSRWREM